MYGQKEPASQAFRCRIARLHWALGMQSKVTAIKIKEKACVPNAETNREEQTELKVP